MSDLTICPNCNSALKSSFINSNHLLTTEKVKVINGANNTKIYYYCNKCGNEAYEAAKNKIESRFVETRKKLRLVSRFVPVITTHSPYKWEYTVIGMVTGQTTTGTGFFSEVGASVADLFGGQAEEYNKKLKGGERMCFDQLRGQAISMGGNAVIGADIDYSEVGGGKGMLMVCMAGTAVKLHNLEVLSEEVATMIKTIPGIQKEINFDLELKQVGDF